jgi:adenylosuccinate lyase
MSVVSDRYASKEMKEIWSAKNKVIAERRLWIAILKHQSKILGVSDSVISDYERVVADVDLKRIEEREFKARHDVKARIDEFNELAGHQQIHLGMTSRDLTENIEAWQIYQSLKLVRFRCAALLHQLGVKSEKYRETVIVGRSHNVPAQLSTLGKKFANIAEEALFAFENLSNLIERFPIRGIKGPVGTSQDALDLIGDESLDTVVAKALGIERVLVSTGQIYPRSIDFEVLSALVQLSAAPANLATSIRLMAGAELVSEGFAPNQVGSSAMPHKMNSRSCERINGLAVVLRGFLSMTSELVGDQWNEGDVSDSVVRRVAISDAFMTIDGIFETTLTVLAEFGIFESNIEREIEANLPFIATTKFLMAAVKAGAGREDVHAALKEITTKALLERRSGREVSVIDLIAKDPRIPLDESALRGLIGSPIEFTGSATKQVERVVAQITEVLLGFPEARGYTPGKVR